MRLCKTFEQDYARSRQQMRDARAVARHDPPSVPASLMPPLPPCQTCGRRSSPITPTGYVFCLDHAVAHYEAQAAGRAWYEAYVPLAQIRRDCRRCLRTFTIDDPGPNCRKTLCPACLKLSNARPTR